MSNRNDMTDKEIDNHATLVARLIVGPLHAAIHNTLKDGDRKVAFLRAAKDVDTLPDAVREEAETALEVISTDLLALLVLRDAIRMGGFDDFRKAQDRVRDMLGFSKDEAGEKMAPWEMNILPSLAIALSHLSEMVRRISNEPMAESYAALAASFGECSDEELASLRTERDEIAKDNAEWVASSQADMDSEAVTRLFKEVGLAREAEGEDA